MTAELIFNIGIIICGVAVASAIIATIILRISKVRLNKQLDAEYGKRRNG